jgi:aminoglycoside phosphotransferase (APT) family kinase protein
MAARELGVGELTARLEPLVGEQWPGSHVVGVDHLSGGASSLTFIATVEGSDAPIGRMVVKVAPPGVAPVRNRDVLRQYRLLQALGPVDGIEVPTVLFGDAGQPPDVPPLFAMGHVAGESFEPVVDDAAVMPAVALLARRAEHAAAMLGRLHALSPGSLGIDDPDAFSLPAEVGRWTRLYETVEDSLRRGAEECGELLLASAPAEAPPAILHGDYRLGNLLCRGGEVAAIIDWEIWSLGDPRLDLAWFVANTCGDQPTAVRTLPEMPRAGELVACYERATGASVEGLEWFDALVRYKAGATIALIVKHNRRRDHPSPQLEAMALHPPAFIAQAMGILGARRPSAPTG